MAKYKEVHDKQTALENMADRDEQMSKGLFVGFTFKYVLINSIPLGTNAGGYEINDLTVVLDIGSPLSTPMATRAVPANPCRPTPISTPFSLQSIFFFFRLTRNNGLNLLFSLVFLSCFERINEGRAKGNWGPLSRFSH